MSYVPTSFEYAAPTQATVGSQDFQKYNLKIFWDLQKTLNRLFPRLLSNFFKQLVLRSVVAAGVSTIEI